MIDLNILFSLLPFIVLIVLLVGLKVKSSIAMASTFCLTLVISFFYWDVYAIALGGALASSFLIFVELFFIILFAVFFVQLYTHTGMVDIIQSFLASISPDKRVQALLIGFAFVSVMEGAAGFGTPVALAAPFLVVLGFSPVKAVMIGLVGDSVSVVFGAAGTPILVGLSASGLDASQILMVGFQAALINSFLAFIVTAFIVFLANKENILSFVPFILFSALSFTVPFILMAYFVGPELPSIVGGVVSLVLIALAAKHNFLLPSTVSSDKSLAKRSYKKGENASHSLKKILCAFSPFIIMIFGLALSRNVQVLGDVLSSVRIGFSEFGGYTDISQFFSPFYTPSFFFLLAASWLIFIAKPNFTVVGSALKEATLKIRGPMIALFFVLSLAQLLLVTVHNGIGFIGVPSTVALFLTNLFGDYFVLVSPMLGAFGAFVTGSATVSNILFSGIQASIQEGNLVLVSLQVVGSSFGNMVALHNILAACAAVGIEGEERYILRKNFLIALVCLILAGLIGFVIL